MLSLKAAAKGLQISNLVDQDIPRFVVFNGQNKTKIVPLLWFVGV